MENTVAPSFKTVLVTNDVPVIDLSKEINNGGIADSCFLIFIDIQVLVPVANGTEPMEAVITIDILRRAGAVVTVASVEKQLCVNMHNGLDIVADSLISDCANTIFDLIALLGGLPGGAATLRDCATLESMVKKQDAEGRLYAEICAAPALALGSWGLLKDKKVMTIHLVRQIHRFDEKLGFCQATCYPYFTDQLCAATADESRVVRDGNVVTSRGPGTTMEFSMALVEQLFGKEKAIELSKSLRIFESSMVYVEQLFRKTKLLKSPWLRAALPSNHEDEFSIAEINPINWTSDTCPKILVPLANGIEAMEAIMMIDVLRWAEAETFVVSIEDTLEVKSSQNVILVADMLLDDALKHSYDLIVLPGGVSSSQPFADSRTLTNWVKSQIVSERPHGGTFMTQALLMRPHGLIKDKNATTFSKTCNAFLDPGELANRVLIDGCLITGTGLGTSLEFSLAIVRKLLGPKKVLELAEALFFLRPLGFHEFV
ncbi:hypothetical protein RJ639_011443 [Escallonia herrerae]|uniref:DJ-1/PfpI domain-containing protein n=1 Tax=Escallonia herrerae TaxID=1293975 RepID=A0AA88VKK9_9ASTE|nr:hypothetical protein RJ639_011443 [Escallonia herrerae]